MIALMSAIIGTIFGISQKKINDDVVVNTLLIIGTIGFIVVVLLINIEEKKRNKLIDTLEITKEE